MASKPPHRQLSKNLLGSLKYFDKFDYPLTFVELKYWQSSQDTYSGKYATKSGYYFLAGRSDVVTTRRQREVISQSKWQIAQAVGEKLQMFPTIAAVFVTGALAMNNTPADDDIDLMIVTYAHSLWFTRLLLVGYLNLKSWRRQPGLPRHHGLQVVDKICDNLWLDTQNLAISERSLRTAHEILQAKVVWDRGGIQYQFLKQNPWVKKYLPYAYKLPQKDRTTKKNYSWLWPINALFFVLQYLYMVPKKTSEKVGIGYAFFHPNNGR